MNKFSGNIYLNPAYQIDASRSNVNRIMNPSVRYFPRNEQGEHPAREQHKAAEGDGVGQHPGTGQGFGAGQEFGTNQISRAGRTSGTNQAPGALPAAGKMKPADPIKASAAAGNPAGESPSEAAFKLDFSSDNILNAFILSELLGKPKILRKRRW
jgi:hypothetical protein